MAHPHSRRRGGEKILSGSTRLRLWACGSLLSPRASSSPPVPSRSGAVPGPPRRPAAPLPGWSASAAQSPGDAETGRRRGVPSLASRPRPHSSRPARPRDRRPPMAPPPHTEAGGYRFARVCCGSESGGPSGPDGPPGYPDPVGVSGKSRERPWCSWTPCWVSSFTPHPRELTRDVTDTPSP